MRVKLTYFKRTGKYYSEGEYNTDFVELVDIWDQVRWLRDKGSLPGLVKGHSEFIVFVDVPDHPHNHPRLIVS